MLHNAVVQLEQASRGRLIQRSDLDYDEARTLYNGMIDKRPLIIAQCLDAADVVACVGFAREAGLGRDPRRRAQRPRARQRRRRAGHRPVPDARGPRRPARTTVRVAPVAPPATSTTPPMPMGSPYPSGSSRPPGSPAHPRWRHRVPVAAARPDHRQPPRSRRRPRRRPNGDRQPDQPRPVLGPARRRRQLRRRHQLPVPGPPGRAGLCRPGVLGLRATRAVMRAYREFLPRHPKSSAASSGSRRSRRRPFPVEHRGELACAVISCYNGPAERGAEVITQLLDQLPEPLFNWMGEMPFPAMQGLFDPFSRQACSGTGAASSSTTSPTQPSRTTRSEQRHGPSALSMMHLYPIDGAVHRIGPAETAWNTRAPPGRWSSSPWTPIRPGGRRDHPLDKRYWDGHPPATRTTAAT